MSICLSGILTLHKICYLEHILWRSSVCGQHSFTEHLLYAKKFKERQLCGVSKDFLLLTEKTNPWLADTFSDEVRIFLEKQSVMTKEIPAIQIVGLQWGFIFCLSKSYTLGGACFESGLCNSWWMSNNNYKVIVFDDKSNSSSNNKKPSHQHLRLCSNNACCTR